MAIEIQTDKLDLQRGKGRRPAVMRHAGTVLTPEEAHWVYNGMDGCLTMEINERLEPKLNENQRRAYEFTRAMQGPALSMMLNGLPVDQVARSQMLYTLEERASRLEKHLNSLATWVWGVGLNPRSPSQLQEFFYEVMGVTKQYTNNKGERRVSTNRPSLEAIAKQEYWAEPIVRTILSIRNLRDQAKVLKSGVDNDGRMRCTFNVAGTETFRWSSSKGCRGGGMNAQNPTDRMRRIFVAPEGFKLAYLDLEQAESYCVAYISGDQNYLAAIRSGDLHTFVTRMIWTDLPWTQDMKKDKSIAEQPFYRHFSYRDMSKRGGHLSNYKGSAWTAAKHLKIDRDLAAKFQSSYFRQFPGIPRWHAEVNKKLLRTGKIVAASGFERTFFGRLNDDATLREAIAFEPQHLVGGYIMPLGIYRCWHKFEVKEKVIQVLANMHDGFVFAFPEREREVVDECIKLCNVPMQFPSGTMEIPVEAKSGYAWRSLHPGHPDYEPHYDMHKWGSKEELEQERQTVDLLDIQF